MKTNTIHTEMIERKVLPLEKEKTCILMLGENHRVQVHRLTLDAVLMHSESYLNSTIRIQAFSKTFGFCKTVELILRPGKTHSYNFNRQKRGNLRANHFIITADTTMLVLLIITTKKQADFNL